jgi:outer membrane lipoprotein SlyB
VTGESRVKRHVGVMLGIAALAVAAGCAPGPGGDDHPREQGRREQSVRPGVVDSVREVQLEGTRSGVGPAAGAVIGGIGGSTVSHGRGSAVGAVVGSVVGGVAGQAAEEAATRKPGLEITIRLENGQLIAVTQGVDETFRAGDPVRVLSDGITTRVTH